MSVDPRIESPHPETDQPATIQPSSFPSLPKPEVQITGMNGALKRWPIFNAVVAPLLDRAGFVPQWSPFWTKIKTFGVTFPAGMEFLPVKQAAADKGGDDATPIPPPKPAPHAETGDATRKKSTRVKPPSDALSLEDRLFYVLQPPLETWLKGQELIMPFEPFSYQYEGIAWLFAQKSALLADEMGLGKTMQTITALRLLLRAGQVRRVLMVCPKPLIPNWQREFKTWAEEIPVTTVEGDGPRRKMIWQMPGAQVLLCNYEVVVRDFQAMIEESDDPLIGTRDGLGRVIKSAGKSDITDRSAGETSTDTSLPKFDLVVLDEAQRIKNRDSITARTARLIPRKRSLCLTGTPIENRPEEMYSLFEFMGAIPPHATPDIRQLSKLSEENILRRTKDLVMKDMPPRLDRNEYIELSPAQQQAYHAAEQDGVIHLNEMGESITVQHVFELVMRLKQITNYDPLTGESSKLDRLIADMEEISASGGKAILFSQWTRTIDWLAERTQQFGRLVYHGGVPTKQREPILAKFKEDPNSHLLLMSYGTGAVGLNLQFAGYVFLYDRWWNPAVEDQAINRAHRIGCKSQVIVSKFICKDTIEERIDLVLNQKRELFRKVLGEGDNSDESLSLSASEIFGLFDLKKRNPKGAAISIGPKKPEAEAA